MALQGQRYAGMMQAFIARVMPVMDYQAQKTRGWQRLVMSSYLADGEASKRVSRCFKSILVVHVAWPSYAHQPELSLSKLPSRNIAQKTPTRSETPSKP